MIYKHIQLALLRFTACLFVFTSFPNPWTSAPHMVEFDFRRAQGFCHYIVLLKIESIKYLFFACFFVKSTEILRLSGVTGEGFEWILILSNWSHCQQFRSPLIFLLISIDIQISSSWYWCGDTLFCIRAAIRVSRCVSAFQFVWLRRWTLWKGRCHRGVICGLPQS